MIYTNKFNIPEWIVSKLVRESHPPNPKRMSTTDLIHPPRMRTLRIEEYDEITTDVSDLLNFFDGENLDAAFDDDVGEQIKMEVEIDGITLVGKLDRLIENGKSILLDRKRCKVGGKEYPSTMKEWECQLNCYDKDTEVLTNGGWKLFCDLSSTDLVCCLNPDTEQIEYLKPDYFQAYHYSGEMYHFLGRGVDLLVTPEHNVFCKTKPEHKYELHPAYTIPNKRLWWKKTGRWKGNRELAVVIPGVEHRVKLYRQDIHVPIEQYVDFMAWYLSEGWYLSTHSGGFRVGISQSQKANPEKYNRICSLLTAMGIRYHQTPNSLDFNDKRWWEHLKQFGKSKEKHIPDIIKNLPSVLLQRFISIYAEGDGSQNGNGWQIATASIQMANDLQEIALKAGYTSSVKHFLGQTCFTVSIITEKEFTTIYPALKVPYEGMVYDITLPKYHVFMVRRNGIPVWSGNCYSFLLWKTQGKRVDELQNHLFYKDWTPVRASDPSYPLLAWECIIQPHWSIEDQEKYIHTQLEYHATKPYDCPEEERWGSYAVMKEGRKTALRVLKSRQECEEWMLKNEKGDYIQCREGLRCRYFCGVSSVCPESYLTGE